MDLADKTLTVHYGNGVFGNVYLLDLGNTKRQTLLAPHCRNGNCRSLGAPLILSLGVTLYSLPPHHYQDDLVSGLLQMLSTFFIKQQFHVLNKKSQVFFFSHDST